jgi:hypothetical protein
VPEPAAESPDDINLADWKAAELRGPSGPPAAPLLDLKAPGPWGPPRPAPAVALSPTARRSQRWLNATRVWAFVKMCSFGWSVWWLVSVAKMPLGGQLAAYGLACYLAGLGGRWRRRWFGPGQLLEPELYEDIGTWFYRLGTVLVLCGGAAYLLQHAH